MSDELKIVSFESSYGARLYAIFQQAVTGIPYEEFKKKHALRIGNTLYAPEDFVIRVATEPTQFDIGALVYEVSRASGKSKEESEMEEELFLDMAEHHFASGPSTGALNGIAETFFDEYLENGIYVHTTSSRSERRPFPA